MNQFNNSRSGSQKESKKKWFTVSNISTVILLLVIVGLYINPQLKSKLMQGMMEIGLFQPDVSENRNHPKDPVSGTEAGTVVSFQDETGKVIPISAWKGKVVFINFWATWCPPCLAEMPSINQLQTKLKENPQIIIVMVDVDGNAEKAQAFMAKNDYNLPVFTPASAIPANFLGV